MSEEDNKDPEPLKSVLQKSSRKSRHKRHHGRRFQSEPPAMNTLFPPPGGTGSGLEEEAEGHLLRVLEERRARATSKDADWDPSVEGEQPPLRRVTFDGAAMFSPYSTTEQGENNEEDVHAAARLRFQNLAMKVRAMHSRRSLNVDSSEGPEANQPRGNDPTTKQGQDEETDVFQGVGGVGTQIGQSVFSQADTNTDMVISAAMAVVENYNQDDETGSVLSESVYSDAGSTEYVGNDGELLPLTGRPSTQGDWRRRTKAVRRKWRKRKKRCMKTIQRTCRCHRYWFAEIMHPVSLGKSFFRFLTSSFFAKLGFPSLVTAFILFYYLQNPSLDFIGAATISWWLVFIARQTLTWQLAIVTECIVIDGLALKSRYPVKLLSPLLTLCVISSKGWPFLSTIWALWDMILLHGDNTFQQNWFYWTDITLFSPQNKGGHILEMDLYLRLLLVMVLVGVATAIKRTVLALFFGKKTVLYYKPRMDKLRGDMLIISDVAQLGSEAEDLVAAASDNQESIGAAVTKNMSRSVSSTQWQNIADMEKLTEGESHPESLGATPDNVKEDPGVLEPASDNIEPVEDESLTDSYEADDDDHQSGYDSSSDDDSSTSHPAAEAGQHKAEQNLSSRVSLTGSERAFENQLDRWEEPENKSDKAADASISDILDFRKQLAFMDTPYPFSSFFGKASTRDECIKSAQRTYRKLMKLNEGAGVLSFDVIGLLAIDPDDGVDDESKKRVLKRLFRPDRFNEISLLAFVQACDSVYKRLRYFRASVGNASVIDHVLEQIIDGIFYFVLLLVTLSLLKFNPWTLLVSISTLLFSTAFAIGPSLSRYIEGVLMIIARRPYDLGDRILVVSSDNPNAFGSASYSWFVEDLNLFSTTLRFANTNEVATVNNASIVMSRIVNCNRSPNALVTLTLYFSDAATEDQLTVFRDTVDSFVQDRSRIWADAILFFRCESINQDLGLMEYTLRLRHMKSWQDAASIMMNKAEVLKFCFETGKKLRINYDSPPRATWTINSFAPLGEDGPADMEAALSSFSASEAKGDPDTKDESPSRLGLDATARVLLQGKAKGMRSLEKRRTRTGGQFTFNR